MICKLKKLILEVSLDLEIYFIYTVYCFIYQEILHLNFCCHFLLKKSETLYCRFSYAGNWELVKSIVGKNWEEAMFAYILKWEIGYGS